MKEECDYLDDQISFAPFGSIHFDDCLDEKVEKEILLLVLNNCILCRIYVLD